MDPIIGTLEQGKRADYILVKAPDFDTDDQCYEQLVAETEPQHVHEVVVGGNILKSI